MRSKGIEVPSHFAEGLAALRELRNVLHHGDGDPSLLRRPPQHLKVEEGSEPHPMANHIENYYRLLVWVGKQLSMIHAGETQVDE
jgi:hypothetical protein